MNIVQQPLAHFLKGRPNPPEVLVIHYSAGFSAQSCFDALNSQGLSAHFTLERDGTAHQHVALEDRAYHAGGASSSWLGQGNMNTRSVGIEVVNFGWVKPFTAADNKLKSYRAPARVAEVGADLVEPTQGRREGNVRVLTRQPAKSWADHRPAWRGYQWCHYPEVQMDALVALTLLVLAEYPNITMANIIGHEHCDPQRKSDPGPAFPWETFLARVASARPADPRNLKGREELLMDTRAVQSHLTRLGLLHGAIDGLWGPITQKAAMQAVTLYGREYGWADFAPVSREPTAFAAKLVQIPGFPAK